MSGFCDLPIRTDAFDGLPPAQTNEKLLLASETLESSDASPPNRAAIMMLSTS